MTTCVKYLDRSCRARSELSVMSAVPRLLPTASSSIFALTWLLVSPITWGQRLSYLILNLQTVHEDLAQSKSL